MRKNKLVLSFSAGMDSSVLLFLAAKQGFREIHTLSFDYGQRHKKELEFIDIQLQDLRKMYPEVVATNKVLDVSYIKDISPTSSLTNLTIDNPDISKMAGEAQPVTYVPFRNQMFLSICCAYGESLKADTIWYGAAQVDSLAGMWDATDHFVELMNSVVEQNREHRLLIGAPLLSYSKKEIVSMGIDLGVKFENTWTCYSNREDGLADATTPSSSLRIKGFIDAGFRDPIQYVQQDKLNKIYEEKGCKAII